MAADPLREMVEREMAKSVRDNWYAFRYAVDVAVRLVRRWGHKKQCICGIHDCDTAEQMGACVPYRKRTFPHFHRDPACAPPDAGGDKEGT